VSWNRSPGRTWSFVAVVVVVTEVTLNAILNGELICRSLTLLQIRVVSPVAGLLWMMVGLPRPAGVDEPAT
jgi:hypothetical protein